MLGGLLARTFGVDTGLRDMFCYGKDQLNAQFTPERVLAPAPKNHERRHLTNQRDGFAIKNAARQLCQVYVCTGNVVEPRVMVNYREQLKLAAIISKPQTYKASNEPKV